jgi:hypothetical protein
MADELRRAALSLDAVIGIVTEIAQDPESRDRLRALKLLTSLNSSSAAIPPPLTDEDVIARMRRLMKAAGSRLCLKAYRQAYPLVRRTPVFDKQEMEELGIFMRGKIEKLKSLKQLYRMFPEIKRSGVPTTYPVGAGPEVQMEWIQKTATKILMERRRKEIAEEQARIKEEEDIDFEEDEVAGPDFRSEP